MLNTRQQSSEFAYRAIFEGAPVALWDEDFSGVKRLLDDLSASGIRDVATYLRDRPSAVRACVDRVRVRRVNRAAREFYGAENEEQLIAALPSLFDEAAFNIFREEVIAFAGGASTFDSRIVGVNIVGRAPAGVLRRNCIRGSRRDFLEPIFMVQSAENGSAFHRMSRRNTMPLSALLRGRT